MDIKTFSLAQNHSDEFILYNPYVEEFILVGVLSSSDLADYIFSEVNIDLFFINQNKLIFETMTALYLDHHLIDSITIIQKLKDQDLLELAGGSQRILNLSKLITPLPRSTVRDYVSILKDKATKRYLIQISKYISDAVYENQLTNEEILSHIDESIIKIRNLYIRSKLNKLSELVIPAILRIKSMNEKYSTSFELCTGFPSLDQFLNGLQKGSLIIVAGRPAMGKTAFGLALLLQIAAQDPNACMVIFSLEMSKTQIIHRIMSMESKIPAYMLKQQKLYESSFETLSRLFPALFKSYIYIEDRFSVNINDIKSSIKKIYSQHKRIDFILLDYLQLLGEKSENRAEELGYITRSLKGIAKEFNVPIVALSQLNRRIEQRVNKEPLLSDLRESGCIALDTSISVSSLNRQNRFTRSKTLNLPYLKTRSSFAFQMQVDSLKHLFFLQVNHRAFLKLTANHQILTSTGWKRLDQLRIKDLVCTNAFQRNKIKQLHFSQIYCQKPLVIRYTGKGKSFDIMSPPFMNFFANNIVVHNSIEQDADIVLMIHKATSQESQHLQQPYKYLNSDIQNTEIFIAKNRNGPTGKVNLMFYSQIALFQEAN